LFTRPLVSPGNASELLVLEFIALSRVDVAGLLSRLVQLLVLLKSGGALVSGSAERIVLLVALLVGISSVVSLVSNFSVILSQRVLELSVVSTSLSVQGLHVLVKSISLLRSVLSPLLALDILLADFSLGIFLGPLLGLVLVPLLLSVAGLLLSLFSLLLASLLAELLLSGKVRLLSPCLLLFSLLSELLLLRLLVSLLVLLSTFLVELLRLLVISLLLAKLLLLAELLVKSLARLSALLLIAVLLDAFGELFSLKLVSSTRVHVAGSLGLLIELLVLLKSVGILVVCNSGLSVGSVIGGLPLFLVKVAGDLLSVSSGLLL